MICKGDLDMPHNKNNDNQLDEDYKFIQETIKPTNNRRAVMNYIIKCCISGLIFGMFTYLAFYGFKPWMTKAFKSDDDKIVIEDVEDDGTEEEYRYDSQKFIETFNDLHDIANDVANSIVSIRPYSFDEASFEVKNESVSGVVIAETDDDYFILTQDVVCDNAEFWKANFRYNNNCNITYVGKDNTLGIAVFSVPKEVVPEDVKEFIKVSALGNSSELETGDISLAVGNIFGMTGGTDYGIIEGSGEAQIVPDRHCSKISVDMFPVTEGGGFLFNVEGEVVGMFSSKYNDDKETNALAISDIKPIIEILINGKNVPYIGIYGEDITEEMSEEKGIPSGVYVLQVHRDSPALDAGISNADIVCQLGDTKITTNEQYEEELLKYKPGDVVKVKAMRKGAGDYVEIEFNVTIGSTR